MAATTTRAKPAARLRLRPVPTLAAVAAFLLGLVLAFWQLNRAEQKQALQARIAEGARLRAVVLTAAPVAPEALAYRTVSAHGEWAAERTILLDNKVRQGVPGYRVVTPLRLAGSDMHILVDRGWIAAPRLRSELPRVSTPGGSVEVTGTARVPRPGFTLSDQTVEGRVWQNLDLERYRQWSGLTLQPVLLVQQDGPDDGLARGADRPDPGIGRHYGFAAMWFALGTLAVVMMLYYAWRGDGE